MKLLKIQKFLKENDINYKIDIDIYNDNEFAEITICDSRTKYTEISEIAGKRGKKASGILLFFKKDKKNISIELTSQNEVIDRLRNDIKKDK